MTQRINAQHRPAQITNAFLSCTILMRGRAARSCMAMAWPTKDAGVAQYLDDSSISELRASSAEWRDAIDATLTRLRPVSIECDFLAVDSTCRYSSTSQTMIPTAFRYMRLSYTRFILPQDPSSPQVTALGPSQAAAAASSAAVLQPTHTADTAAPGGSGLLPSPQPSPVMDQQPCSPAGPQTQGLHQGN